MTSPIERVYVIENGHEGPDNPPGIETDLERAESCCKDKAGTIRVFVEEPRWIHASVLPSNSREVLLRYRPHGPTSIVTRLVIAIYGSEGKWVAIDHDYRREYLHTDCVVSWQELPVQPVVVLP